MEISGAVILQLLSYFSLLKVCVSYNIDVSHARVLRGPKDSLFGYTSAFQRTTGGYKLIVGAPKDNNERRNGTGATYTCDVSGSLNCEKEYTIRDPNIPEKGPSGVWNSDHEMYGSFVTQTVNNTVVICAPRYNDLLYEDRGFAFLIGRCVINGEDYRPLFRPSAQGYLQKIYLGQGINKTIFWNGMGQSGISGDYLADGSLVLGVPGFMEWRGGIIMIKNMFTQSFETPLAIPDFSYLGYSVVSGNFCGKSTLCFATGGPRKESGKVFVYVYTPTIEIISLLQTLQGDQTGSYFGASLCAADVNGDGLDDLLVGAPFYTDVDDGKDNSKKVYMDEGRVTVYLNGRDSITGKVRFEKSSVLEGSNEDGARFGTAIANIGDVNNDGYEDVAIGAPYEDEGRGVVYIYHGGEGGLKSKVKQKIMGRDINDTVTSFGWSISKPADVDNNKYSDFTVGGYLSGTAVILRTRPVVDIQVTMTTDPQLIVRDKSLCPRGFDSESCFRLKLCFTYTGKSLPASLRFNYSLTVDTYIGKDQKRVQLNSSQGLTDTVSANITASGQTGMCHEYQAISIDDRRDRDPFTAVRLEAEYQLLQPADNNSDIQPISNLDQPNNIVKDIAFQLACGDDNQCWSDLVLQANSLILNENDDVIRKELKKDIVINATETVVLSVAVRNDGEDAFATIIYVTWTGRVSLQTTESNQQLIICSENIQELDLNSKMVACNVILPVKEDSEFGFLVYFTADDVSTDMPSVDFSVSIETESNETNPLDNVANVTTNVWIDARTKIDGKADPEQVVIQQNQRDRTMIKMLHTYVITNDGPSYLPTTDVMVLLPYYMKSSGSDAPNEKPLIESAFVFIQIDGSPMECLSGPDREALKQNETTTQAPQTTTSRPGERTTMFLPVISPSKLIDGPYNVIQEGEDKVFIMDCEDYRCEEFLCTLEHLSAGGSAIINVAVQIPAKNLPFEDGQGFDYVKYRSSATVKEPSHPLLYPWGEDLVKDVSTLIYPEVPPAQVNIWIIIGSVIGGIILLILILIVCYKLGFFKREKKGKIQKWKRESAYYKQSRKSAAPKEPAATEESEKGMLSE